MLLNATVAEEIAARYSGRGVPLEDLRQVAYEGLILAVRRFDVGREGDLLSFAIPTIRGEIRRYFRDHGWTIRPPRRIQELQSRIQLTYGELVQDLGREPTTRELSEELGVSEAELGETYCAYGYYSLLSLDRPASDDTTTTVGDLVEGNDSGHADSENRLLLTPAISRLSERDQRILRLRFHDELTQKEIGSEVGITQMQVSRVLRRILATLRDDLSGAAA
ncbi:RNA polymerase sigma factor SigF [Epidermidibacterium keratini]